MSLRAVIAAFSILVATYFVLWNLSQMAMAGLAARQMWRYQRRRTARNRALIAQLTSPPFVSIVIPARNEQPVIVEAIRSLLALDYDAREIVIVNDGSTDDTLATLKNAFHLVSAPSAFDQPVTTAAVRGIYHAIDEPDLVVVDKDSAGCKADAANAGINAASGTLVLVIDADTMLEPDALTRAVLPFLEDPETAAVGGYVAIANGSAVDHGRVVDVRMPRNWLVRFQIVEYMRSFLLFRSISAAFNGTTIISGAFGLFRRDALLAVGGFDREMVAEDMDLTIRLQAHFRRQRQPIRTRFVPIPVCWTQGPEDWRSLRAQRCRWRRGLLQVLWRHRHVICNPRFGMVGLVVLPYTAFFEGFGPLIETAGYVITTAAAVIGLLNWGAYGVLLALSVLFGATTTLMAVFLSDSATRRYRRVRDLVRLGAAAALENVGYRQLNAWWGCVGTIQSMTGKRGWGTMKRQSFS